MLKPGEFYQKSYPPVRLRSIGEKEYRGYFGHSWTQVTENGSKTHTHSGSEIQMPSADDGVGVDKTRWGTQFWRDYWF